MSARCRSCGDPITWALTETGRRMPINAEPAEGGNIRLIDGSPPVAIYESGNQLSLLLDPDEPRYVSHFATCGQAKEWRKN